MFGSFVVPIFLFGSCNLQLGAFCVNPSSLLMKVILTDREKKEEVKLPFSNPVTFYSN